VDLDGYVDALATLVMADGTTAVRLLRNEPCTASTSSHCFGYADGGPRAAGTVPSVPVLTQGRIRCQLCDHMQAAARSR